jgi:hypothetical protein
MPATVAQALSYTHVQTQPTERHASASRVNLRPAHPRGPYNTLFKELSMASRNSKSSGSSSRSQAASKGARASNQNSEAQSERARGNSGSSKRSSTSAEKKSSSGSKSGK